MTRFVAKGLFAAELCIVRKKNMKTIIGKCGISCSEHMAFPPRLYGGVGFGVGAEVEMVTTPLT